MDELLSKVKTNLILEHTADDALLKSYITAAVSYAESYQHIPCWHIHQTDHAAHDRTGCNYVGFSFYESRRKYGRLLCG